MNTKNKTIIFSQRLFVWVLYLFAGITLYSKKGYLYSFLLTFSKVIYPLSIFWLQITIKRKGNFLPIDASMTTSQLWFNILPVIASFITVILTSINAIFYITNTFI